MINKLLAFVALFFSGKASKSIEESTRQASKLRVLIYLVLSIILGVFLYKTYQVASIINIIQVDALRVSYDSSGNIADSIGKVAIFNRFGTKLNYKNGFMGSKKDYLYNGGVYFNVISHEKEPFIIKDNPNRDYLNSLELPVSNPEQVFHMGCAMTSFSTMIPIYPLINYKSNWKRFINEDSLTYYSKFEVHTLGVGDNVLSSGDYLNNDYGLSEEMIVVKEKEEAIKKQNYTQFDFEMRSSFANTLNIFTAADISQYTHMICVDSDCPVDSICVFYDVPIEVTVMPPWLSVGTTGFSVTGDIIKQGTLEIHVKLPTLANLQMIRSLFLTTLLTALLTLFFRNLYFLVRKWAVNYRKRNYLPYSKAKLISRKRVNRFRRIVYLIFGAIIIMTLYLCYLIAKDSPILIQDKNLHYFELCIIGITLVLAIIVYAMYCYARKPVLGNSKKNEDEQEQLPTIFLHEKDEEDEFDKLVETMHNERRCKKHSSKSDESVDND